MKYIPEKLAAHLNADNSYLYDNATRSFHESELCHLVDYSSVQDIRTLCDAFVAEGLLVESVDNFYITTQRFRVTVERRNGSRQR